MPGPIIQDPTPEWMKAKNASVLDPTYKKVGRSIAHVLGLDDPQSQVLAMATPLVPEGQETVGPVLKALRDRVAKTIRAFHGSPHDFEKFSLSKIGTGEGAQAYGHGLYFAENEGIARSYREGLSTPKVTWLDGPEPGAVKVPGKWVDARQNVYGDKKWYRVDGAGEWDSQPFASQADAVATLPEPRYRKTEPGGRMYEVSINADPDQLLDWDKPYTQQSAAQKLPLSVVKETEPSDSKWLAKMGDHTINGFDTKREAQAWVDAATGGEIYRAQEPQGLRTVNDRFRQQGIPGIKYLDGGSRAAGEGSRNYVIFDDSLVSILKKYGVALPVIEGLRQKAAQQNGQLNRSDVNPHLIRGGLMQRMQPEVQ
tara:strand:+ start:327 stop:1433 length:1107 start_codon:yes stop_codon:yes gene_type:complete